MTDIICGKCGKHFSSVELAREHSGHCKETSGQSFQWITVPKTKLSPAEWDQLMQAIKTQPPVPNTLPEVSIKPLTQSSTESSNTNQISQPGIVSDEPVTDASAEDHSWVGSLESFDINSDSDLDVSEEVKPEKLHSLQELQACPSCKQHSLVLNANTNQYECFKCGDHYFKVSIDKYNDRENEIQKSLDEIDKNGSVAWVGNQRYNSKKKIWESPYSHGQSAPSFSLGWLWLFIIVGFLIASLIFEYFNQV